MYAIIEESGGQRMVRSGDEFLVDLAEGGEARPGAMLTFSRVLVVGEADGSAKLGTPYVAGAAVEAEVLEPLVQGDKLYIQKFRPKKSWKKKTGHRQPYTRVKVTAIKG